MSQSLHSRIISNSFPFKIKSICDFFGTYGTIVDNLHSFNNAKYDLFSMLIDEYLI